VSGHFEVIGDDGMPYLIDPDEVEGDVMGDVMGVGYEGPMGGFDGSAEVVGYDHFGDPIVVGARGRRRRRGRHAVAVRRPGWRAGQLAPGVIAPDQGLLPLPLSGNPGATFSSTVNAITFEGQIQKPFKGERILVSTVRTGATAVGRLIAQLFVGTDLNQLDVPGFDAEQLGDPNAFGVRLSMKPAQPGVFLRLVVNLSAPLTAPDTIFTTVTILGKAVH